MYWTMGGTLPQPMRADYPRHTGTPSVWRATVIFRMAARFFERDLMGTRPVNIARTSAAASREEAGLYRQGGRAG